MGKLAWNDPDHVFGGDGDSYTLMAVASWKIFDGGASWARLSRSRREEAAAKAQKLGYEQKVEFEIREAGQAIEEARARLAVTAEAVGAAERAHTILEERFAQGVARMTDLLDAETMLNETRLRELEARFEVQKSLRGYLFVVGLSPVPEVIQ
jgi:outer membrane protein TolC